jgi:hypothetical protein
MSPSSNVDQADPDEAFTIWHEACARSRQIVAAAKTLDVIGHFDEQQFSLRWVLHSHDRGVCAAQRPR